MNLIAEMLSPESRRLNDVANTKGNSSTLCGYGYHMAMIFWNILVVQIKADHSEQVESPSCGRK